MNTDEFATHYHQLIFKLACYEKKGTSFQNFFEVIMAKADSSFIAVKPHGRDGDWKNDGFSVATGTVFQCYAPDNISIKNITKKIEEDFEGAKKHWGPIMRSWVFVWSAYDALPPRVLKLLTDIGRANPHLKIDNWNRESLWQIVKTISKDERESFLGVVPELAVATEVTSAEVQALLNYLVRHSDAIGQEDIELLNLEGKIKRNKLSIAVKSMIRTALPLARIVERYTKNHYDMEFSAIVAKVLSDKYQELKGKINDPDNVFSSLVAYVLNGNVNKPRAYWASVGIVSHYFELCEVFER